MRDPLDLSIIIPVAPGGQLGPALKALRQALPRGVRAEVIIVSGIHPSRQRNMAGAKARGRVVHFLDHDALVEPNTIRDLLSAMKAGADVAGGPNLGDPNGSLFQRACGVVSGSAWATPFFYTRYTTRGTTASAKERDLILCNLMIRKTLFVDGRGFDPRLYPNEENELMSRLTRDGFKLVRVPQAIVRKSRPRSWAALTKESFRYGRGRMQQAWVNPQAVSPFSAALAIVAAVLVAVLMMTALTVGGVLSFWYFPIMDALPPLAALVYALSGISLSMAARRGIGIGTPWYKVSVALMARHSGYVGGLMWGLLTGWRARKVSLPAMSFGIQRFLPAPQGFRLIESDLIPIGVWNTVKEA